MDNNKRETRSEFRGGGDRNSTKIPLKDRLEGQGSRFLKGPTLTFEAQKGEGTDFFQYGGTRADLDNSVRDGNTSGANRFRTVNDVKDIEQQMHSTIYRDGPDGGMDSDKEFGVDFISDHASGGTKGFRQNQARDNIGRHNGNPTEYNPDNTVFRKSMPAPGGYSAPGVTSDGGRGPGGNYFNDQGESRKNLKGFTRRADQVNHSDYGDNDPWSAAEASVYRNRMDTEKYHPM
jgi:hypothetical protein